MENKIRHFKDGKLYLLGSSKIARYNQLYALTNEDKLNVDKNLKKQKLYLKSRSIHFSDSSKSFFDMSYACNIRPEIYSAEVRNRVDTLQRIAKLQGFNQALFLTLTPPTHLKPLKTLEIAKNIFKMIKNPNYNPDLKYVYHKRTGEVIETLDIRDNVKEARQSISARWRALTNSSIFQTIYRNYGSKPVFMKTFEPHIDGSPHLHAVLFIPELYKREVKQAIKKCFQGSRYHVKDTFQDEVGGVVSYIMKYILKSFLHSKDDTLDDVGYWYAKHKIMRFTTSRQLMPLKLYRLIKSKDDFKDYLHVTKHYMKNNITAWLHENPYTGETRIQKIVFKDPYTYDYQHTFLYNRSTDFEIDNQLQRYNDEYRPALREKEPDYQVRTDGHYKGVKIHFEKPYEMNNMRLYKYFKSLDIDKVTPIHYGHTKLMLIERGILNDSGETLQDFDDFGERATNLQNNQESRDLF